MNTRLERSARLYFQQYCAVSFDDLVAPLPGASPCGENLRGNGVYRSIQEARREDDATVPMGPWAHELKRAEWDKVADVATGALLHRSKDLQVAAWLLEARIRLDGFAGIGPCVMMIGSLCEQFWGSLYPRSEDADGDVEYLTNVIHWMDDKLMPVLRLVPLTHVAREGRTFNWADWEQARRNEQRRATHTDQEPLEGADAMTLATAMAGTPSEWHRGRYDELDCALRSLDLLTATLNRLCSQDAPSLNQLAGLLDQIQTLIASELHKRGVRLDDIVEATTVDAPAQLAVHTAPGDGAIANRAMAYARLAEVAEYLQQTEPHSPVPYLLRRAISWGGLNTAELYQEVFVRFGGRLDIFELLGLSAGVSTDH